jgi:hypothetical protein
MRYVIMANGRGTRWGGHTGVPKHLIEFDGETLLRRIVRQLAEIDPGADVVISASDPRYATAGARLHTPAVNAIELDRFVPELIDEEVCFLYGDTLYSTPAIEAIVAERPTELAFFGDERGIVAVRSGDADLLRFHLDRVRALYLSGAIGSCVGWQVYQSFEGLPFEQVRIGPRFRLLTHATVGFNSPDEHDAFRVREDQMGVHGGSRRARE